MDASSQLALAYALTTTAGLRGFLTLFAASLAAHYGWIHPAQSYAWLASGPSTVVLGAFAVAEVIGDKIPVVDHALHAMYFAVRPIAGAILVGGTVHTSSPIELYALMGAGALNALIVHGSSAATRVASTATTIGVANAPLSFGEDVAAIAGIVLAFLHPFVAAAFALLLFLAIVIAASALYRRRKAML